MKLSLNPTPQLAGKLTMVGVVWFWLSFVLLGFVQPGYQPIRDTISILVVGQYGWIQQLNFWVLAITTLVFGLGLSRAFYGRRWSLVSSLLAAMSLGVVGLMTFQADPKDAIKPTLELKSFSSLHSLIHLSTVFFMALVMMGLGIIIFRQLATKTDWRGLRRATFWLISLGAMGGVIWLYGRFTGSIYAWKGLFQKILVTDILVWVWLMARKLTQLPEKT